MSSALVDLPLVYRQTSDGPDSQIDRHPFRPGATWIGRIARQGEIPASKQAAMSGQFPSCDNTQLKLLPVLQIATPDAIPGIRRV
jgi:hypothetical protein